MGSSSDKIKAIPMGVSPQENKRRAQIFRLMDVNGNNYLSLAEIDKGCRDVLELPELFETKPVIMRAYQAAKNKFPSRNPYGEDYVSKAEFRFLLIYLREYYEYWENFQYIEQDGDRRISEKEFMEGQAFLNQWGIKVADPKATFEELLKKNNAQANITFTEFCDWACNEHLKNHPNGSNDHTCFI